MQAELHPLVTPYEGRITDVDSHEQIPAQVWVDVFGEDMRAFSLGQIDRHMELLAS